MLRYINNKLQLGGQVRFALSVVTSRRRCRHCPCTIPRSPWPTYWPL